jgi:hypothetical protein
VEEATNNCAALAGAGGEQSFAIRNSPGNGVNTYYQCGTTVTSYTTEEECTLQNWAIYINPQ